MSKHILVEVLSKFTKVTEEEELDIRNSFPIAKYKKGTYLLREGQIAREAYFVIKGCVREYMLTDGEEQTTAFFTENQSVINFNSISNQRPSKINFICTEATSLAVLNSEKEQELYKKHLARPMDDNLFEEIKEAEQNKEKDHKGKLCN